MSNAIEELTVSDGFRTTIECFNCPRCERGLGHECFTSEIDKKGVADTRRDVTLVCEDCRKAFAATYQLFNGQWIGVTPVHELTGREARKAMKRVDKVRGNRVVSAC